MRCYVAGFAARGRDPGGGLGPQLGVSEGHPQRARLLAHHLYERAPARGAADIEHWTDAYEAARREAGGEIDVLWQSASDLETQ